MSAAGLDFPAIHQTYRARITRYLAGLAGDNEADDLCQEVFAKLDKGLENFRAEAQLPTWIYRIATNTYLDYLRSRSFQGRQREQLTPHEQLDAGATDGRHPEPPRPLLDQQLIRDEMRACVRGYIDQLPDDYRIVLLLSDEGFKNREIAAILEISLENVKVRLHRARTRLKESLKGNCDFYLDERSEIACDRKQNCD